MLLLLLASLSLAQSMDLNLQCITRLEMPAYPPLARAARLRDILSLTIVLGERGAVARIENDVTDTNARHFVAASEAAVRKSKFAESCGGATVRVVFHFELSDATEPASAFAYPNHFYIRAPAVAINPTFVKPAR